MNGVEILNQTNIYQTECLAWLFWLILGVGFTIGLIFAIVEWVDFGFDSAGLLVIFLTTILSFFIGVIAYALSEHNTDELAYVEYQVTISDEVNFNEFDAKYEILDQEGKIYTVKEKQDD